jgi:hypothetical protein
MKFKRKTGEIFGIYRLGNGGLKLEIFRVGPRGKQSVILKFQIKQISQIKHNFKMDTFICIPECFVNQKFEF